jgi:hypothetical protein
MHNTTGGGESPLPIKLNFFENTCCNTTQPSVDYLCQEGMTPLTEEQKETK